MQQFIAEYSKIIILTLELWKYFPFLPLTGIFIKIDGNRSRRRRQDAIATTGLNIFPIMYLKLLPNILLKFYN